MEGGAGAYNPRTAEEVFRDFRGRRAGMIKALTTDVEKFYQLCDPDKENLCLYGLPNETWEVNLPAEEVPPELPEPALGINFARDGMDEKDWLSLVAVHSDAWLLAVAFYFGARFGFDKDASVVNARGAMWGAKHLLRAHAQGATRCSRPSDARRRLFQMINGLPTIFEVVTGTAKKQTKERTPNSSKSNKSNSKPSRQSEIKTSKMAPPKEDDDSEAGGEEEEEDEDEHGNTLCGACGENYANDEFWICCDICERWFHGKCVRITPARAEHIKQYKCPACSNKRARA
ncbi:PHD finger protein ALFIN-LIKE 8-like isoform X1 [Asparagus officinalis]|uniref:PHD finger protein ALFIN-LIKE 8-like isoform X1 n=1 Tax=Asparagus officinalis TaxID=4686 RepID=UPI00098E823F|nr:PHD finger protein ALFIN-LIKE 8-like isoform X1 [Asparagus officinalis]